MFGDAKMKKAKDVKEFVERIDASKKVNPKDSLIWFRRSENCAKI